MKISVIIPVYNGEKTVKKAIDSVLNQNFPKNFLEIIVVNDGSTDNTLKILKTYGRQIKIINQKNQGAVRAANRGFKKAKGKYVIKLDADDYFEPDILKEMADVLNENLDIDFVYCDYYEKSAEKIKIVSTENIFNTVAIGIMFRKNKLAKEKFYNEGLIFPEYDLLIKIQNKWKGYYISKPLFCYNRRRGALTSNSQLVQEGIDQLRKLYPDKKKEINKIRKY